MIIPTHFFAEYLAGEGRITLELVKNPAQSSHPAIVEEAVGVLTTALNAIARNFRPDLSEWRRMFEGDRRPALQDVADLAVKTGEKIEIIWKRMDPIPVAYDRETKASGAEPGGVAGPGFNLFAFLLPGLTAMFLLFLADTAMRDLHREIRFNTFQRFCTLPPGVWVFVMSKVRIRATRPRL